MPDLLDEAKEVEMRQRQAALANTLQQAKEPEQDIQNGIVVCISCGINIPKARLSAKPDAARCIDCQTQEEAKHGR